MNNVLQTYSEDDMRTALKGRQNRNTIGHALGRAYPTVPWHVDVNVEGGIATITCPQISLQFGMVLHLTRDTAELERGAVRMGGELLERFRVSRDCGDFSHLIRSVNGEVYQASRGEQ